MKRSNSDELTDVTVTEVGSENDCTSLGRILRKVQAELGGTYERDFEDDVELYLDSAGWKTFIEERKKAAEKGEPEWAVAQKDYDRQLAIKTDSLLSFIKETQPNEWAKVEALYGAKAKDEFLKRVNKVLKPQQDYNGLIDILRKGFEMPPGAYFRLAYFKPANDKNPGLLAKYNANRFEVVRQLEYGNFDHNSADSIDMVLFLNGLPLVTLELKNNISGQRTAHAAKQYMRDRDSKELIFQPNRRALVHFALDSETVEMCTWLKGSNSFFMPFNKGNGMAGGGNPINPKGYRTEYLYSEILAPDSLLDIIQRFVRVEYKEDSRRRKVMDKVIFPRYHQLDAVRKLTADAKVNGPGHNYLIQHSAGSGKSNSIAWLAHNLQSLHGTDNNPVFDSVIVLTDRKNLDSQLSVNVDSTSNVIGVVRRIEEKDGSSGLKDALNSGAQIITSTIQKFPYICRETEVAGKKFAVIIDEAHSSQTGRAHAKMKYALTDFNIPDPDDPTAEDEIVREILAQGTLSNLSIFAFTATPKASTLEVFGTKDADGNPAPFHLYSMKQAIEEGFILDVLENYTVYDTYFKLVKTITDDPLYKEAKANKALVNIVRNDHRLLDKRAAIIVEHFMNDVSGELNGKSKAMVVTHSRSSALAYYKAIKSYAESQNYDLGVLVAFSGTLKDDDREWTESSINGFPDSMTAAEFDKDDYRIIVCANKFQTGFDQPKLCAMYVDKVLTGVAAVQTLSRLNRCYPSKRTFVLDFVNDWETIRASFSNYYEMTEIDEVTDPSIIYDTKRRLDTFGVYDSLEVDAVARAWFGDTDGQRKLRHIEGLLSPAVDRWNTLETEKKVLFKALLKKFLKTYSFITQMLKLGDEKLHCFFVYASLLVKKLFIETSDDVRLRDKVEIEYLRVENRGTKSISLKSKKLHNAAAIPGIRPPEEKEFLSELVRQMNERFGTDWKDADKLIKAVGDKIMEDEDFVTTAKNNSMNEVKSIFMEAYTNALISIINEGGEMADTIAKNPQDFEEFLRDNLLPYVYWKCREDS
ncbi:MAG: type I restriction endonuclease [Coriobacteriales bacterium]